MESSVFDSQELTQIELKKKTGSFYTPNEIAEEISSISLSNWLSSRKGLALHNLIKIKILDPSVGDGIFLEAAGRWLYNARRLAGDNSDSFELRKQIAQTALYGVDVQVDATKSAKERISEWVHDYERIDTEPVSCNVVTGNSLVGHIQKNSQWNFDTTPFHWHQAFPGVFKGEGSGFDLVLGNPPYGNLLTHDEKSVIKNSYTKQVYGGRQGTWNLAALFISRVIELLRDGGHLGFLIPNSILRVGQFSKTRKLLMKEMRLDRIIDYGNPFDDVTLEMVGIFSQKGKNVSEYTIRVEPKREDIIHNNSIDSRVFSSNRIFSLYHDEIFDEILRNGSENVLTASRGRDIPKTHVNNRREQIYSIPYLTSGRSVKRYHVDRKYLVFSDDWYQQDRKLTESYENAFLVATKNYPYPRCILKPKGFIHGGGIVRISSRRKESSDLVNGLILNSELIRYVCVKYLTNYSQLTTCLNTGIMEEIPIVIPEYPHVFEIIFQHLQSLHSEPMSDYVTQSFLDTAADALVYSIYFDELENLEDDFEKHLSNVRSEKSTEIYRLLLPLKSKIRDIMDSDIVEGIKDSPRMS